MTTSTTKRRQSSPLPSTALRSLTGRRGSTLLLLGFSEGFALPQSCQRAELTVASHPALTPRLLASLWPDTIAMPLLNGTTDALSHLRRLQDFGFRGRCIVLAPPLPDLKLVQNELRSQAYSLRISVLSLDP